MWTFPVVGPPRDSVGSNCSKEKCLSNFGKRGATNVSHSIYTPLIVVYIIPTNISHNIFGACSVVGVVIENQNYHPHPHCRAPCMKYVEGSIRPIYMYRPRKYVIPGP